MAKKKDKYPKYLYVIYDESKPIYVGVTALLVEVRFSSTYRSEYIMKNKKRLTYRVVDLIKSKEELIKEQELILHFISKGHKLENKIISAGAGLPTGGVEFQKLGYKLNGEPKEEKKIRILKENIETGKTSYSKILNRPKKIQQIKDLLDSGMNLYQISKYLNMDYGNLYRFHKKYITCF
jgi:hypothetical protein